MPEKEASGVSASHGRGDGGGGREGLRLGGGDVKVHVLALERVTVNGLNNGQRS